MARKFDPALLRFLHKVELGKFLRVPIRKDVLFVADHHCRAIGVQIKFGDLLLRVDIPDARHWINPSTDQVPIVDHFHLVNQGILVDVYFENSIQFGVVQNKETD